MMLNHGELRERRSLSLDRIKRLLDSLDIDERPPPIVKLADRSTSCSIVSYNCYGQPIRFYSYKCHEIACHIREAP